jgi:hypothetical protein
VALSSVQQGVIGQFLAAVLMMLGSNGLLEIAAPMSDDERRDQEVHIRGLFEMGLALQVKTSTYLPLHPHSRHPTLQIQFNVVASRLINHPRFWYLFGYLDKEKMGFGDPLFLVPSATVHEKSYAKREGERWHFELQASMSPTSHDMYAPYQVAGRDLGKRVLQIIREAGTKPTAELASPSLELGAGTLYVAGRRSS